MNFIIVTFSLLGVERWVRVGWAWATASTDSLTRSSVHSLTYSM